MLAPNDFANIKANVKVASTENGIIFGNIVYDILGAGSDRNVVVLNDIHIDIMDYIVPASCTETEFRSMWAEFEWENKVCVCLQSVLPDPDFVKFIATKRQDKFYLYPSSFYWFWIWYRRSDIRDPISEIGKNQDSGSGINIPDPQHWLQFLNFRSL